MRLLRTHTVAAALALFALAGCAEDDATPIAPVVPEFGGDLFTRYVSLGNSITAGFQSGGITARTQLQAYPVLVADQAGAPFNVPLLADPGCPPPLADPFSGTREAPIECALRAPPAPGPIQNLAVPGARIIDATSNLDARSSSNALTTFILGGRTQVQAMLDAEPTLVSAWLGNNDALSAALGGTTVDPVLTPLATFQGDLDALVSAIEQTPAAENDAVVLFGTVDVSTSVPALQPGAFFFSAAVATSEDTTFLGRKILPNCSPLIPADPQFSSFRVNPLSRNQISLLLFATTTPEQVPAISCDPAQLPPVLSTQEQATISQRIADFNQATEAAADARGWIYIDPNDVLAQLGAERTNGIFFNRIRNCQALSGLLDQLTAAGTVPASQISAIQQQIGQAIGISCPVTGATQAPNFFGSLITFDGIHPSAEAHVFLANAMITELNAAFGLSIPTLDEPAIQ